MKKLTKILLLVMRMMRVSSLELFRNRFPKNLSLAANNKIQFSLENYLRYDTKLEVTTTNEDIIQFEMTKAEPEHINSELHPFKMMKKTCSILDEQSFYLGNSSFAKFCDHGEERSIMIWSYTLNKTFSAFRIELNQIANSQTVEFDSCSKVHHTYREGRVIILCQEKVKENREEDHILDLFLIEVSFDTSTGEIKDKIHRRIHQSSTQKVEFENLRILTAQTEEFNIIKLDIILLDFESNHKMNFWLLTILPDHSYLPRPYFKSYSTLTGVPQKIQYESSPFDIRSNGKHFILFLISNSSTIDIVICNFGANQDCPKIGRKVLQLEVPVKDCDLLFDVWNQELEGNIPKGREGERVYQLDYVISLVFAIKKLGDTSENYRFGYLSYTGANVDSGIEIKKSIVSFPKIVKQTNLKKITKILMRDGAIVAISHKNQNEYALYHIFKRNEPHQDIFNFYLNDDRKTTDCYFIQGFDLLHSPGQDYPFPSPQTIFCLDNKNILITRIRKKKLKVKFLPKRTTKNQKFEIKIRSIDHEMTGIHQEDSIKGVIWGAKSKIDVKESTIMVKNKSKVVIKLNELGRLTSPKLKIGVKIPSISSKIYHYAFKNLTGLVKMMNRTGTGKPRTLGNNFISLENSTSILICRLVSSIDMDTVKYDIVSELQSTKSFLRINSVMRVKQNNRFYNIAVLETNRNTSLILHGFDKQNTRVYEFNYVFKEIQVDYGYNNPILYGLVNNRSDGKSKNSLFKIEINTSNGAMITQKRQGMSKFDIRDIRFFNDKFGYLALISERSFSKQKTSSILFFRNGNFIYSSTNFENRSKILFSRCWVFSIEILSDKSDKSLRVIYNPLCQAFYSITIGNYQSFELEIQLDFFKDDINYTITDAKIEFEHNLMVILLRKNSKHFLSLMKIDPLNQKLKRYYVIEELKFTPAEEILGIEFIEETELYSIFMMNKENDTLELFQYSETPELHIDLKNSSVSIKEYLPEIEYLNTLLNDSTLLKPVKLEISPEFYEKVTKKKAKNKTSIAISEKADYNLDDILRLSGGLYDSDAYFRFEDPKSAHKIQIQSYLEKSEKKLEWPFTCLFEEHINEPYLNCDYLDHRLLQNYLLIECTTEKISKIFLFARKDQDDCAFYNFSFTKPKKFIKKYLIKKSIDPDDIGFNSSELSLISIIPEESRFEILKIKTLDKITFNNMTIFKPNFNKIYGDSVFVISRASLRDKRIIVGIKEKDGFGKEFITLATLISNYRIFDVFPGKVNFNSSKIGDFSFAFNSKYVCLVALLIEKEALGITIFKIDGLNIKYLDTKNINFHGNTSESKKFIFLNQGNVTLKVRNVIFKNQIEVFLGTTSAFSCGIIIPVIDDLKIDVNNIETSYYQNLENFYPQKIRQFNGLVYVEGRKIYEFGDFCENRLLVYQRKDGKLKASLPIKREKCSNQLGQMQSYMTLVPNEKNLTRFQKIAIFEKSERARTNIEIFDVRRANTLTIHDYKAVSLSTDYLVFYSGQRRVSQGHGREGKTYSVKNLNNFESISIKMKDYFGSDYDPKQKQISNRNKSIVLVIITILMVVILLEYCKSKRAEDKNGQKGDDLNNFEDSMISEYSFCEGLNSGVNDDLFFSGVSE